MTLDHLNLYYNYQYDPTGLDCWNIMKPVNGRFKGDCEDYALSVLYYIVCNESLLTFWQMLFNGNAKICYVTNGDSGHAVLQFDGKYIDNWTQEWVTKEHMESLGHKFHKRDYMFYQVALKMLNTKIRGIF